MARIKKKTEQKAPAEVELVSVPDVAKFLNVHRNTVYRMLHAGLLPKVEILNVIRIPMDAVRKFVNNQITTTA